MSQPTSPTVLSKEEEQFSFFVQHLNGYVMHEITETLLGRILTFVDASCPASPQIDALKSLIKQEVWETYWTIWSKNSDLQKAYDIKSKPLAA